MHLIKKKDRYHSDTDYKKIKIFKIKFRNMQNDKANIKTNKEIFIQLNKNINDPIHQA